MSELARPDSGQTPGLKKIDITIARLRLMLADITARESGLAEQRRTCDDQREKLMTFAIYGDSSLDSVLTMLTDVEERAADVDSTLRQLASLRRRAESELESLQLTKGIEEAKALLAQLQARQLAESSTGEPGTLTREEVAAEISRLQLLIAEASERAAKSIEMQVTRRSA